MLNFRVTALALSALLISQTAAAAFVSQEQRNILEVMKLNSQGNQQNDIPLCIQGDCHFSFPEVTTMDQMLAYFEFQQSWNHDLIRDALTADPSRSNASLTSQYGEWLMQNLADRSTATRAFMMSKFSEKLSVAAAGLDQDGIFQQHLDGAFGYDRVELCRSAKPQLTRENVTALLQAKATDLIAARGVVAEFKKLTAEVEYGSKTYTMIREYLEKESFFRLLNSVQEIPFWTCLYPSFDAFNYVVPLAASRSIADFQLDSSCAADDLAQAIEGVGVAADAGQMNFILGKGGDDRLKIACDISLYNRMWPAPDRNDPFYSYDPARRTLTIRRTKAFVGQQEVPVMRKVLEDFKTDAE